MNTIFIKTAIIDAISLLNNELESVSLEELGEEYKAVIDKLEKALMEIDG